MASRAATPSAQLVKPPKRSKRPTHGPALASYLRKEIRIATAWGLTLACVGIVCMMIVSELRFSNLERYKGMVMTFSSINSFSTLLLMIIVYRYYHLHVDMLRAKNTIQPNMGLSEAGLLAGYLIETFFLFLHTPPFLLYPYETPIFGAGTEHYVEFTIGTLDIMMVSRLLLVVRVAQDNSALMRQSGHLIGELANIKWDTTFITKSLLNSQPMRLVLGTLVVTLFASAYVLFLFERNSSQDLNYGDALWLIVITMTTVGYGDLKPVTFWGRTAAIVSAAIGVFLTALVIGVIHAQLQLTTSQSRLMTFWNKTYLSKKRKHLAASLIQAGWLYHRAKRIRHDSKSEFKQLWELTVKFRNLRRDGGQPLSTENTTNIYIESLHTEMRTISGIVESMKDRLEHIEVPITPSSSQESSPAASPEPEAPKHNRPPPLLAVPGGGAGAGGYMGGGIVPPYNKQDSGDSLLGIRGPSSLSGGGFFKDDGSEEHIRRLESLLESMQQRLQAQEQATAQAHRQVIGLSRKLDAICDAVERGGGARRTGSSANRRSSSSLIPTQSPPTLPHMGGAPAAVPPLARPNDRGLPHQQP